MSKSTAFPGWYIELQAAFLRQAPRPGEITADVAQSWLDNQAALKEVMAEALLPPQSVAGALPRFDPEFVGAGWSFWRGPAEGDGLSGEQEKERSAGRRPNSAKLKLETCLRHGETRTTGEERRRRLRNVGGIRAGADQFRWFWERQDQIPAEWENKVVFFDDTVLRSPDGYRFTLYLYRRGGRWYWRALGLSYDRFAVYPSLLLAS